MHRTSLVVARWTPPALVSHSRRTAPREVTPFRRGLLAASSSSSAQQQQHYSFRVEKEAYKEMHKRSIDPKTRESFWLEEARKLEWFRFPNRNRVLDVRTTPDAARWFSDGEINASFNCLDRHVMEGRHDQVAIYYDSPVTGVKEAITYMELLERVEYFAGVLRHNFEVQKGDTVIIYMPMIPETLVAMLACTRIGAIHSVVFGGFAAKELAVRIDDAKPAVVLTANCGVEPSRYVEYIPMVEQALAMTKMPRKPKVIVKHRKPTESRPDLPQISKETVERLKLHDWDAETQYTKPVRRGDMAKMRATDTIYILYTSGSTGTPKGIERDTGGHLVQLRSTMDHLMNIRPGDTYFCASDCGWVVGHSFILYGPLLAGASTVLFEGKPVGTPDAGTFWRIAKEYNAKVLFTAPTAIRAIKRLDLEGEFIKKYAPLPLRALFLAGERADVETVKHFHAKLGIPVVDNWWQTETGASICGLQDVERGMVPGSTSLPMPGFEVRALHKDTSRELGPGEMGELCIRLPLPPGALVDVYNNHERYVSAYMSRHPGWYSTGDVGFVDDHGYVTVMSRDDDLIKVAGHRLSTGTIESAIVGHPSVAECAVIGAEDSLKGELPLALLILNPNAAASGDPAVVEREVVERVRELVGPVAAFNACFVVNNLPKTRSGKILRGLMKKIADEDPKWRDKIPGTIEDAKVLDAIEEVLKRRWIAHKKTTATKRH